AASAIDAAPRICNALRTSNHSEKETRSRESPCSQRSSQRENRPRKTNSSSGPFGSVRREQRSLAENRRVATTVRVMQRGGWDVTQASELYAAALGTRHMTTAPCGAENRLERLSGLTAAYWRPPLPP